MRRFAFALAAICSVALWADSDRLQWSSLTDGDARANLILPTLAKERDAMRPARGMSIDFTRSYPSSIRSRKTRGPLGYGWMDSLTTPADPIFPDGLLLHSPQGDLVFQKTGGKWRPVNPNVHTALAETTDAYVLLFEDGTLQSYSKDNLRLSFVKDNKGNALTFTWNGGNLARVSHTDGQSLAFGYLNDLMAFAVDDCGRKTVYHYENNLLVNVTAHDGKVTRYEYQPDDGTPSARALRKIIRPDKTTREFQYDDKGRVVNILDHSGMPGTAIERNHNHVTIVARDGGRTAVDFGESGEVLRLVDPLGNAVNFASNTPPPPPI